MTSNTASNVNHSVSLLLLLLKQIKVKVADVSVDAVCHGVLVLAPWGTLGGWSCRFSHASMGENGPPPTQCVSGWEQDGVNSYDITVTSQSQHTVAAFPKCLLRKSEIFLVFLFHLKLNINTEFESPDPLWPQTFWETQSGSHDAGSRKSISQSALALPPSVLHSCYWLEELSTHQTQR